VSRSAPWLARRAPRVPVHIRFCGLSPLGGETRAPAIQKGTEKAAKSSPPPPASADHVQLAVKTFHTSANAPVAAVSPVTPRGCRDAAHGAKKISAGALHSQRWRLPEARKPARPATEGWS
jgi:hypothetical protein